MVGEWKTINMIKNNMFQKALLAILFSASGPAILVTKNPSAVYITIIDTA